jgi:hypothetical protein
MNAKTYIFMTSTREMTTKNPATNNFGLMQKLQDKLESSDIITIVSTHNSLSSAQQRVRDYDIKNVYISATSPGSRKDPEHWKNISAKRAGQTIKPAIKDIIFLTDNDAEKQVFLKAGGECCISLNNQEQDIIDTIKKKLSERKFNPA